jgi:NADPH:quinone reductase-like Zn-dependent oxidoreductase
MFEPALKSLAHRGRLVEISSLGDRRVSFDLIDFYHNESRLFGVNTLARDAIASALWRRFALRSTFELEDWSSTSSHRLADLGRKTGTMLSRSP